MWICIINLCLSTGCGWRCCTSFDTCAGATKRNGRVRAADRGFAARTRGASRGTGASPRRSDRPMLAACARLVPAVRWIAVRAFALPPSSSLALARRRRAEVLLRTLRRGPNTVSHAVHCLLVIDASRQNHLSNSVGASVASSKQPIAATNRETTPRPQRRRWRRGPGRKQA